MYASRVRTTLTPRRPPVLRIDHHAAQVADFEADRGRAPRGAASSLSKYPSPAETRSVWEPWGEWRARGCPGTTGHAVAPCAAAVGRGHERPGLNCDPKSSRFDRVTRNPANVMSLRFRRKGPFRRRRQRLQSAGLLHVFPLSPERHTALGSVPAQTTSRSAGLALTAIISRPARPTDRQDLPPSSLLNTPSRWVPHHARP